MRGGEWAVEYRGPVSGEWFERGRHPSAEKAAEQAEVERTRRSGVEVRIRNVPAEAAAAPRRVA